MFNYNKEALVELFKSFGRFMWFGILGLLGTFLTDFVSSGDLMAMTVNVLGQTLNLGAFLVLVIGFVIKAIDRYIHENKKIKSNGLAPEFLQG